MGAQVGPGSENIVPRWLSTRMSRSRMTSAAMSPCGGTGTSAISNAGAVASDFGLRDLRRDYPGVESITRTILAAGDAHPPTILAGDDDRLRRSQVLAIVSSHSQSSGYAHMICK
jgi:hypothetical protein